MSVELEQQRGGMYGTELLDGSNHMGNWRDKTGHACPLASASASAADASTEGVIHVIVEMRTGTCKSIIFCRGKAVYVLPTLCSCRV